MKTRSTLLIVSLLFAAAAVGSTWTRQGPSPINDGQVENITNNPVVGAINVVVAHPSNTNVLWVGAVNGGIWKSTDATTGPTWTPETDTKSSLSISALVLDSTDINHNTLVAGTGATSSFSSTSGPVGKLFRTTDGATWSELSATGLANLSITGIIAHGATIVVSSSTNCAGILRSTNTGSSFSTITSGLPSSSTAWDLAYDPTNGSILYAALHDCSGNSLSGIYRSTDIGATWARVSDSNMNSLFSNAVYSRIAVGSSGQVYVGIISPSTPSGAQLGGLFRSSNGTSWVPLDVPYTTESGVVEGINPGRQGARNFSIVADPSNSNLVYVGGDRQPGLNPPPVGDETQLPNSIGAGTYSGRLFRVDASAASNFQATPLTHCRNGGAACNNAVSTSNNTAPHADSRGMTFWNGSLLEADDGGIYKRSSPSGTGDWFSMNGNLQVSEVHDVVYDHVSKTITAGNQDTGTPTQSSVGGTTWSEIYDGDGGDVGADDTTSSTQSTRYYSYHDLGAFTRGLFNSGGTQTSSIYPTLTRLGSSPAIVTKFVTPVELNHLDATRLLIAGSNDIYESLDKGDTITAVGFGRNATAVVYGGRSGGVDNLNVIWAISGAGVYVRTSGSGSPLGVTSPGPRPLRDIAVDPTDWQKAYVIDDQGGVFYTSNTGSSWTTITGNLGSSTTDLRTVAFISGSQSAIAVGGLNGVFQTSASSPGTWTQSGSGLSNALVMDLDYDATDDVLVAGTLGRGVWSLSSAGGGGTAPPAPTGVTATATSATSVSVAWNNSTGATDYHVYRSSSISGGFTEVCSSSCSSGYSDATAASGTSYLYKVRAVASGVESGDSNLDLATTVVPADNPPTAILANDIILLRAAVNDVRTLAGVGSYTFTDADNTLQYHAIKGIHVQELRSKLQEAWTALSAALPTLTVPSLTYQYSNVDPATNGGNHYPVRQDDITILRDGVK